MTLDELNKLDLKTLADWPLPTKLVALAFLCVVIVLAGWWFDWRGGMETLDTAKQKETELRSVFTTKKNQAINLDAYKKQLADIEQAFGALLKQLPNKQEMDALITDVNQAGLGRGLQFDLFRPQAETVSEFYAETPIQVKVTGGYHDIAAFVSDVSKLPRIVTLQDISMQPAKDGVLNMDAIVKTYRYLDDDEAIARKQKAKEQKK
ncbi:MULTISPECIES: type 4a pilus biogenesis protein PilO [unclassified Thiobacillus]|uniref:type 4a pilus biogenesis protein PilO n=1 Tax=unclassified Thiobacillus TaxID=2646513 RepID=UPI00086F43DA|nr:MULTISPECIES: type 4a pilus biogenesis protein PilO [unclassified Thiobacillus]MBN8779364.1 type 4a pilus biogenesis protein PilO [Thiobacillus sp.]MBS0310064.1 type 4a pilus biogenesis protein PilO [Pseudomonadota bacterium]MBS0330849.1 type 4a pilus biogenesis protein PilO [Pseudomonadota bacterium]ODV00911.1 MAG: pilus assembly protein PilO [Thiobacillus sp. SCN 63-57]